MDTTLRDGEQTSGVSFAAQEKLSVARLLLEELHVDRIEIASARVSEGEFASVKRVAQWARNHGHINQIEVLGFVDGRFYYIKVQKSWKLEFSVLMDGLKSVLITS